MGTGVEIGESSTESSSVQGSSYSGVTVFGTNVYLVQPQQMQHEYFGQKPQADETIPHAAIERYDAQQIELEQRLQQWHEAESKSNNIYSIKYKYSADGSTLEIFTKQKR